MGLGLGEPTGNFPCQIDLENESWPEPGLARREAKSRPDNESWKGRGRTGETRFPREGERSEAATRLGGFEPPTSRSGGARSIP
jgi:hypothetical protein